jgi:hypothetical protein
MPSDFIAGFNVFSPVQESIGSLCESPHVPAQRRAILRLAILT